MKLEKSIKVNYIVAFYSGARRSYPNGETDVDKFLNKHLEFLNKKPKYISGTTFIINKGVQSLDDKILCKMEEFKLSSNIPVTIIIRENEAGSYGAWERGIMSTYKNYTHSFLIEDDYIPSVDNVIEPFWNKMISTGFGFIASLWRREHAAISNGLLNNNVIESVLKKHDRLFNIKPGKTYDELSYNQLYFLKYINERTDDICDEYNTIFLNLNRKITYGNENGITLIEPI